ncbi:MAG: hypothetical protein CR971_00550 [candidate division SR1 bacterium]|nr:MAG: hypothetical protein CR971_00550 [candidate division SR1 bacterium]
MLKQKIHNHLTKRLEHHLRKHGHHRIHHVHHAYHHIGHTLIHLGEMIVASVVGIIFMIGAYASPTILPNNTQLVYPVSDVAKLHCRPNVWSEMDKSCITKLPIIHGANYKKYLEDKEYRFNYTVLWRGTYYDGWDPHRGAHPGVDLANVKGTPLYAIANGTVYYAGWQNGYGNVVKIRFRYHGNIYYAVYAHTNKIYVKKGQSVYMGQKIAEVGNTGLTIGGGGGYHVHFEINKEKNGRLEYYLTGCPDRKVGDFGIVDKGLCRKEIGEHQVDPIALLESAGATLVKTNYDNMHNSASKEEVTKEIPEKEDKKDKEDKKYENTEPKVEEKFEKGDSNTDKKDTDNKIIEEKTVAQIPEKKEPQSKDTVKHTIENKIIEKVKTEDTTTTEGQKKQEETKSQTEKKDTDNTIIEKVLAGVQTQKQKEEKKEPVENTQDIPPVIITDEDAVISTGNLIDREMPHDIDEQTKHFFSLYDIKIYASAKDETTFHQADQHKIIVTIVEKSTHTAFNGILPLPINFITNNNKLKLSYNQGALVKDGKLIVDIVAKKQGNSAIIIMLRNQKLVALKYQIE